MEEATSKIIAGTPRKKVSFRPDAAIIREESNQMEEAAPKIIAGTPRKMRFTPKIPSRRTPKPVETKAEVIADVEAAQTAELLRRVNEGSRRRGPKFERKSEPVQVAFGYTGKPTSIRTFGRDNSSSSSSSSSSCSREARLECPVSGDGHILIHGKKNKEYVEPWNYYSYYPVTLPLRRPHSGNPELLDEEEFEDASESLEYDENSTRPAAELGLTEEFAGERMLFFQLPASLPLAKRSASAKGKEINDNSKPLRNVGRPEKVCGLEELPAGFMGKMLVYKSGAVKLKLGETVYDVSPGSDCMFAENVAAINVEEKHCCVLGDLDKRVVVTPDIDSLLSQRA